MRTLSKILICSALVVSFAPESAFAGCLRARGFGRIDGYADRHDGTSRRANKAEATRVTALGEFLAEPFVPGPVATVDRAQQLSDCYEEAYLRGVRDHKRAEEKRDNFRSGVSGLVDGISAAWDRYVSTPFARWLIPTAKDIDFTGAGTGVNVARDADTRTVPAAGSSGSSTGASAAGLKRE